MASSGAYTDKILLQWSLSSGARSYQVWRAATPSLSAATLYAETGTNVFSDTSVACGRTWYYWVRARTPALSSSFSTMAAGWRRSRALSRNNAGDFDGDGRMDIAVYEPATGAWLIRLSSSQYATVVQYLGGATWQPVPADYDGDGRVDPAVYQSRAIYSWLTMGYWAARLSSRGYAAVSGYFGADNAAPVPADYNGDYCADLGAYGQADGVWAISVLGGGSGIPSRTLGGSGYTPAPADYDGAGKADMVVYCEATGIWLARLSGNGYAVVSAVLGGPGYVPVIY